ncbi:MAG: alpha-2-macroglobulin family protein, partial [Planctomycetota bacterium]
LVLPDIGPDEDAWVITASRGTDINFVQPDRRTLVMDHVDQDGRPHPGAMEAMLYAERGAYRPGDTVHLTAIVRGGDGDLPPAVPMAFSITRPDGREVARIPVEVDPSAQGIVHARWESPADGQVGRHVVRLLPPGAAGAADADGGDAAAAEAIGSVAFLVEEFERVRLEVEAAFSQPRFLVAEPIRLDVAARSMFGTPAAGLPVRFSGAARIAPFSSVQHPEMRFGDDRVRRTHRIREVIGELEEAGDLQLELPRPAAGAPAARWRITGDVSVTQIGGRTVSRWVDGSFDTAEGFLGLAAVGDGAADAAGGWLPVGTPVEHAWVCVGGDDAALERAGVAAHLERIEREMVLQEVRGRLQWRTVDRIESVERWTFEDAAASGRFAVTLPQAGRYRLTITGGPRDAAASVEFHAAEDASRFAALANERPERIELTLDKDDYRPGETAVLSMRSAFMDGGTALLTLETDRVLAHRVVRLDGRDAQVELPLDASIRGGAFITVSMVRAIDPGRDSWLPHRAAGTVRVPMGHADQHLDLSLDAPSETRPGTEVPVRLQVTGGGDDPAAPAVAHVWAVDEGLLQVTLHRTPDPHAFFLGARERGVRAADMFGDLLPDHARPASVDRIGGDEAVDTRRRGVVRRPREIPAVLWRAAVPVASDGSVSLTLPIPAMQGRLRLMAVAADGDRYGTVEHGLVVAAPVTVESSWPRSVAAGDRFEVAVTATNRTDADLALPLSVVADGPLRIDPASLAEPMTLPAGGSAVRWLAVEAVGLGPVRVRVQLGDD